VSAAFFHFQNRTIFPRLCYLLFESSFENKVFRKDNRYEPCPRPSAFDLILPIKLNRTEEPCDEQKKNQT
jgi:hypothetical protein